MSENTEAKENAKNDLKDQLQAQINSVNKSFKSKDKDKRTQFEKEYDKVLFSAYFRALSDKTQVVPLSKQDHNHNRLTHSLEVASVGYSFGNMLDEWLFFKKNESAAFVRLEGEDIPRDKDLPLIIATACLLHDIGNPPFGHAGEEAIKHFFKNNFNKSSDKSRGDFVYKETSFYLEDEALEGFRRFDGNANGFRIATRLAGKSPTELSSIEWEDNRKEVILKIGLKLSNITLATGLKYPFCAGYYPCDKEKDKFGYFKSETEIFNWLCANTLVSNKKKGKSEPKYIRHPLAYLVEAADDICNLVIDFEDAIINGHANPENLMIDAIKLWGSKDLGFTIYDDKPYLIRGASMLPLDNISRDTLGSSTVYTAEEKELINVYLEIRDSASKLTRYDANVPIKIEQLKALESIRAEVLGMLISSIFKKFQENLQKILSGYLEDEAHKPIVSLMDLACEDIGKDNVEKFRSKYLSNSLYIHKRKSNIEIAGYKITNHILELFFDSLADFKISDFKFKNCSTRTKHLLRYIGIDSDNNGEINRRSQFSDYDLALRVVDFITKASDTEIMAFYQGVTGLNTH